MKETKTKKGSSHTHTVGKEVFKDKTWETDYDCCLGCGEYEAFCKKCCAGGRFNNKNVLVDIAL